MKGVITPQLANDLVLRKYGNKFNLTLVGSVATRGRSYNDMDILISYLKPEEIEQFTDALTKDDWIYQPTGAQERSQNAARFTKNVGGYDVTLDLYKRRFEHEAIQY